MDGNQTLQFDGAAKGNPGPAGGGAAIFDATGREIWSGTKYVGATGTNNEAEQWGLIIGLRALRDLAPATATVRGDSMLIIRQMRGEWACRSPKLTPLFQEARDLGAECGHVTYEHVQRHDNARADALANEAVSSAGEN